MAYSLTDIVFDIKLFSVGEGDDKLTLTCADKAVLNVLAHCADRETHICWPGHRVIAEAAILSRQQVIDSIKKLDKMEVFKSILIGGDDSPYKSNQYTLDLDRLTVLVTLSQPVKPTKKSKSIKGKNGKTYYRKPSLNLSDLFTEITMKDAAGGQTNEPCVYCSKCGRHVASNEEMAAHIESAHPDLWAQVIPPEIQFLDESMASIAFNIEDEDDELS